MRTERWKFGNNGRAYSKLPEQFMENYCIRVTCGNDEGIMMENIMVKRVIDE